MTKKYMYEVKLLNEKTFKSKYLKEICDFINDNINKEEYNDKKIINVKMIRNYIQRNKNPLSITELKKTDIKDYLCDFLVNECGEEYLTTRTEQSKNRRLRMIYDSIKNNEIENTK